MGIARCKRGRWEEQQPHGPYHNKLVPVTIPPCVPAQASAISSTAVCATTDYARRRYGLDTSKPVLLRALRALQGEVQDRRAEQGRVDKFLMRQFQERVRSDVYSVYRATKQMTRPKLVNKSTSTKITKTGRFPKMPKTPEVVTAGETKPYEENFSVKKKPQEGEEEEVREMQCEEGPAQELEAAQGHEAAEQLEGDGSESDSFKHDSESGELDDDGADSKGGDDGGAEDLEAGPIYQEGIAVDVGEP